MMLLHTLPAHAQRLPTGECAQPGEPLMRMPELISKDGILNGTIVLGDELRRLSDQKGDCALVYLRFFEGVDAVAPPMLPGSQPETPPDVPPKYIDPVPGPTLRARVGDLIELTFLNQVNPGHFPGSFDMGDVGACDNSSTGYPSSVGDTFPNCFHGSSTANIHFHGTHTNPNSTGDNVFLNVRPSPRSGGEPTVTAETVKDSFRAFFDDCEMQLEANVLLEWPFTWFELPQHWTDEQKALLLAFDADKPPAQQLWPVNQAQLDAGLWPQYYVGAFPYCFRLPESTAATWPPQPPGGETGPFLQMGQAPGLHWYHAHKHGSTALNVSNGMTGAFVIEGPYDDALNNFYGTDEMREWTRTQPVLVINQLGTTPNLARTGGGGPTKLSVNGQNQPTLTMRPGEVQLWRIVNTSSRTFAYFAAPPAGFEWRQLAQDGVQFYPANYDGSQNISQEIAPGNRVDLLVKAPMVEQPETFAVQIIPNVAASSVFSAQISSQPAPVPLPPPPSTLFSVEVTGSPPENPNLMRFIPNAPIQPAFLTDITDQEVKYNPVRLVTFNSKAPGVPVQHTLNGKQFSGDVGVSVYLSAAEEWKVENTTNPVDIGEPIDHPFHIHINPFQIVEVFDPNELLVDGSGVPLTDPASGQPAVGPDGKPLPKYVFSTPLFPDLQCQLNVNVEDTWEDCHNQPPSHGIWWDTFPIPSGRGSEQILVKNAPPPPPLKNASGDNVVIPGYFRMRSRFVDYPGYYVIHCHILAHEDRGMMTVVEVRLSAAPMEHH
jgi:FtsP/CotA-like multicopper oxidase with cupredoxin domain